MNEVILETRQLSTTVARFSGSSSSSGSGSSSKPMVMDTLTLDPYGYVEGQFSQGQPVPVTLLFDENLDLTNTGLVQTDPGISFSNTTERYVRVIAQLNITLDTGAYAGPENFDKLSNHMIEIGIIALNGNNDILCRTSQHFPKRPVYEGTIEDGGEALYKNNKGGFSSQPTFQLNMDFACVLPEVEFIFYIKTYIGFTMDQGSKISIIV